MVTGAGAAKASAAGSSRRRCACPEAAAPRRSADTGGDIETAQEAYFDAGLDEACRVLLEAHFER